MPSPGPACERGITPNLRAGALALCVACKLRLSMIAAAGCIGTNRL